MRKDTEIFLTKIFQLRGGQDLPPAQPRGEETPEESQCQVQAGPRHQGEDEGRGERGVRMFIIMYLDLSQ